MTVGLLVVDHDTYAQYRTEIAPLLETAGGGFRYDFEVRRTLYSEAPHEINRVFVIHFPDRGEKDRFFSNPEYRAIRARLFENAVQGTTILSETNAGTAT